MITQNLNSIFLRPVTESEIINIIKTLPYKNYTGPDNIGVKIIKYLALCLAASLCDLCHKCLLEGYFPSTLRNAIDTPIFKAANKENVFNYKLITIINNMGKTLKKYFLKDFGFFLMQLRYWLEF